MEVKQIRAAVEAAAKFQARAKLVLAVTTVLGGKDYVQVGKDSGALRRASMDLTRALAEMRKTP